MRSRLALRTLAVIALTGLVGVPPTIAAAQSGNGDDVVRQGLEYLGGNQLGEAAQAFRQAIEAGISLPRAQYGLGMVQLRQGETRAAEETLRKSVAGLQLASDLPDAYAALALAQLRNGRPREARSNVDKALGADPGLWLGHYTEARLLLLDGKPDQAEVALERGNALKGVRGGEDLYQFGQALLHVARNDLQGAGIHAQAAVSLNPCDPEVAGVLADIYVKQGAAPQAAEVLKGALDAAGTVRTAAMLQALGTVQERAGQYAEAIDSYQKATQLDGKYAPAYKSIGNLLSRAGKFETALPFLVKYNDLEGGDVEGLVLLANVAVTARSYRRANDAARKAYGLDSTQVATKLALARAAFHDRDKPTSARLYKVVSDTSMYDAGDYTRLAQLALDRSDIAAARRLSDKAFALDPKLPDTQIAQGLIDLKDNKPDDAIAHLQKAVELAADAPTVAAGAQLNLGVVLLQQKRTSDGIAALRKAKALAPDNSAVRLPLAQALVATDSLAAAAVEYQGIVDIDPKNARALRGLATCQIKVEKYADAVKSLETATTVEAGNADGWALLGQAYLGVDEIEKAKSAFEKALAIAPNNQAATKGLQMAKRTP